MEHIASIDDPRLANYRGLRDRTLRGESLFVTEGELVTRRLLRSKYEAQSVLVAEKFADEFRTLVPPGVPLYVGPSALLDQLAGFRFHLGVLAAGRRRPSATLEEILAGRESGPLGLVICPEITKPENLGLVLRSAGAFGVDGVLFGPRCCDPFSRRCLRVSMGASVQVPHGRSDNLGRDLDALRQRWDAELVAAVLDDRAEPLPEVQWPRRAGVLIGNEYEGLPAEWLDRCDRRATIPMHHGVDSLNLGVAAGIFLYAMTRYTGC